MYTDIMMFGSVTTDTIMFVSVTTDMTFLRDDGERIWPFQIPVMTGITQP